MTATGWPSTTTPTAIAGTAPEILIAAIAATTQRIRVGSAGVMLPHYSRAQGGGAVPRARGDRARAASTWGWAARRAPTAAPPSRSTRSRHGGRRISRPRCATCWPGWRASRWSRATRSATSSRHPQGRPCRRSGSLAAPTTARRSPRISGCPTASPISSPTGAAPSRRSTLYRRPTGRARATPSRMRALCVWALAADTEEEAAAAVHARAPSPG